MKLLPLLLCATLWATVLQAQPRGYKSDPYNSEIALNAWQLISTAEQTYNIPSGLLHAISLVETGKGVSGSVLPWPYTVGVNSTGSKSYFSAAAARQAFTTLRAMGYSQFNFRTPGLVRNNLTAPDLAKILQVVPENAVIMLEPRPYGRRFNTALEAESFARKLMAQGNNNLDIGMMQINWRVHGKHFKSLSQAFQPTANLQYAVNYLLEHRQTRDWWASVGRYHSGTSRYANSYIRNVYSMYMRIHRFNNNA